jgi:hypothetical protein
MNSQVNQYNRGDDNTNKFGGGHSKVLRYTDVLGLGKLGLFKEHITNTTYHIDMAVTFNG